MLLCAEAPHSLGMTALRSLSKKIFTGRNLLATVRYFAQKYLPKQSSGNQKVLFMNPSDPIGRPICILEELLNIAIRIL